MSPQQLTPQQIQRLQADFAKQAKELDAREEYLNEREHFLDQGPITLKVLDEQIRVKKLQLADDDGEIEKRRQTLVAITKKQDEKIKAYTQHLDDLLDSRAALNSELETLHEQYADAEKTKKQLQAEIDERKKYLAEQEKIIADTLDDGNMQLKSLQYKIRALDETRTETEAELIGLDSSKTELTFEIVSIEQQRDQAIADSAQATQAIQASIAAARAQLEGMITKNKKVTQEVEAKLKKLQLKEQELLAKQKAIHHERELLDTDKRRWESTKSLYSI